MSSQLSKGSLAEIPYLVRVSTTMKHAVKIALLVTSIFPLHQVLAVEPGNGLTTDWCDPDLQ